MSILDRFRQTPTEDTGATASDGPAGEGGLPIAGYDRLDEKEIARQLVGMTQADLDAVLAYESDNKARPVVIDKLKYLRTPEPLPGYDQMEPDEIMKALEGANGQTLRAVRDYERKVRRRIAVTNAIAEALPRSTASATEAEATAAKAERVASGMRSAPGAK
jgi:hypothetical protein